MREDSWKDLTPAEEEQLDAHYNPSFLFMITGIGLILAWYSLSGVLLGLLGFVSIGMGVVAFFNGVKKSEETAINKANEHYKRSQV